MVIDAASFKSTYPEAKEKRVTGFTQENSVNRLEVQAYVDAALNAYKRNGRSRTGFVVIADNTPIIPKACV